MAPNVPDSIKAAEEMLVAEVMAFIGPRSDADLARFREEVSRLVALTGQEELERVLRRIQTTGDTWGYHPPEDFARRVHYAMAHLALTPDSSLEGKEHLERLQHDKVVFLPNHLSYSDANLFQILLHQAGFDDVVDHLTVIAGPKVYAELFRRFSSLCFGTVKTPQSSSRSSGDAVMSPREVAKLAQQTISAAVERLEAGDSLLVFVEGTRSRDQKMQKALPAVARYFDETNAQLVPVGITGSERLVPVGEEKVTATRVDVRLGPPLPAPRLTELSQGRRRLMMDVIGLEIARLLPEPYRGAYGDDAPAALEEAARIAAELREGSG